MIHIRVLNKFTNIIYIYQEQKWPKNWVLRYNMCASLGVWINTIYVCTMFSVSKVWFDKVIWDGHVGWSCGMVMWDDKVMWDTSDTIVL